MRIWYITHVRREITTRELRWVHITDPDEDDLKFLRETENFHALDVQECSRPSLRPKVQAHPEYLFLVVHIPLYQRKERVTVPVEFDIFVRQDLLVTVQPTATSHLNQLFADASAHEDVQQRIVGRDAAYLLYRILEHLIEGIFPMLEHIAENLTRAEQRIFSGYERDMVSELSFIQRDLAGVRSILRPQRHLYDPEELPSMWNTPTFRVVFRSVDGKLMRVWEDLETLWERAVALTKTNAVLVNYKLNEFVKILTVLSAVFLPLGLVAQVAIFMHGGIPLFNRLVFWGIIGIMFLMVYIALWRAKHRKIL